MHFQYSSNAFSVSLHAHRVENSRFIHKTNMRVDPILGSDRNQTGCHGKESTRNNRGTVESGVFRGPCCSLRVS
jgi:hypothetical protein